MNGWHIQYLEKEDLWYLTSHSPEDGVIFEGFYYSAEELLTDLAKYITK